MIPLSSADRQAACSVSKSGKRREITIITASAIVIPEGKQIPRQRPVCTQPDHDRHTQQGKQAGHHCTARRTFAQITQPSPAATSGTVA